MPKDWIWVFDDHPSDASGPGDNFDRRLLAYAEDTGEIQVDIVFDSTEADYFFSPAGQPGTHDWRVGTWRATVDVTQANAKVSLALGIARVNAAGTFQQAYAGLTAGQVLSSTGVRVFSGPTLAQSGAVAGDRLRVLFSWVRDNSIGGNGIVKFGYGDPAVDIVGVPILMANPRITWNGIALDFPGPLTGYKAQPMVDRAQDRSAGVVHNTNVSASYRRVRAVLDRFDNVAFWDSLKAWWAWARQGKQYAFALDSGDVVDKTMTGAAASGQKDIPFTDTSSIVAGRKYLVRQAAGHDEEVIQVDTITANVKVTCLANLMYSYVTGDIFRSQDYFPKLVNMDGAEPPFDENAGITYSFDSTAEEDRG